MLQTCQLKRVVDEVNRAFDKSFAVGVLDAEDKFAALRFGDKVLVKRRSEVADVHEARGTRRVSGSDCKLSHQITLCCYSIPNQYTIF